MRTKNTFGVHFITRINKGQSEMATIFARITVDGKRLEISLKQPISTGNWNDQKGMAKGRTPEIRELNTRLEQIRARLIDCYQQLALKNRIITAEAIKNLYLGIKEQENTLMQVFDYHNTEMKTTLEWGTLKNYFTTRRYIEEYLKQHLKTSDIFLTQLNYKFLSEFERFMKNYVPKDQKLACGQNTIMKHIERLRKVVNMAIKNEWLDKDPFQKFKPTFTRTTRQFLSAYELDMIEQKEFRIPRLELAKDLFVFSCYTGLAYIDVIELTSHNISRAIDGEYWIITKRHKTDIPVRLPLLPKALEIIEKYKDNPRAQANGRLLPGFSNQKLNTYLKEIADVCGIEKNLSTHIARHTFATTVTLANGVPIETVSKLLGHTSIKTTQIYAKVIESKINDDMKILKTKLAERTTTQLRSISN